jgi:hypothetical protein
MQRRDFTALLGGAAVISPPAGRWSPLGVEELLC